MHTPNSQEMDKLLNTIHLLINRELDNICNIREIIQHLEDLRRNLDPKSQNNSKD